MARQTLLIKLDENLARQIRAFVLDPIHGYGSIDELVEAALMNQLTLEDQAPADVGQLEVDEKGRTKGLFTGRGPSSAALALLAAPEGKVAEDFAEPNRRDDESLFVLTNRLSPIKVATRVLANLGLTAWPELAEFQERSAAAARALGLRLVQDHSSKDRRAIAYPTGPDARKSMDRFITSFTMDLVSGRPSGPMALLGLASAVDGRAVLTRDGWRLATSASPLLDGAAGLVLSPEEAELFRGLIGGLPKELAAVREFLRLVRTAAGQQKRVDELMNAHHPEWSENIVIAQRSALLGRLGDAGVLEVTGRGPGTRIELLPASKSLQSEHLEETA